MNHKEFVEFCKEHINRLKETDDGTADKIINAARNRRNKKNTEKNNTTSSEQDRV